MVTPISAATVSGGPQPYPIPNFNFAWAAGPDGRDFLENKVTPYYNDNPDQAFTIYQDIPGINTTIDPLILLTGSLVGLPSAGDNTFINPILYYYESRVGVLPGSLQPTASIQGFRDYFYSQAEAYGVDFSEDNRNLIDQGIDALIARYATVLEDDNLMKTGSNLNGKGEGRDYIDLYSEIRGVETSDFYSGGVSVVSNERYEVWNKLTDAALKPDSVYSQYYDTSDALVAGFPYAATKPQIDKDGQVNDTSQVPRFPTVFQSLLSSFKELLDSGAYTGNFEDGALKSEAAIRSLLEAGFDSNALWTGQGYGYVGQGSPTAPLGLESQSILERIPGNEFMAFNAEPNLYYPPGATFNATKLGTSIESLNPDFVKGSGFFLEESPALSYDNFTWNNVIDTPTDQFVSQDLFPTTENESLEAIQFFRVQFTTAGLYLDMPETPVSTHLILSSEDVSGDIDEEFSSVEGGPTIADLNFGLGEGFSNFAASSNGDDVVMGGDLSDFIITKDGNDKVMGMAGDDLIDPGAGYDVVISGAGSDTIFVRQESMKGKLAPVSYLTLPDFSSDDKFALQQGIHYEVINDLQLKLTYEDFEKIVVLTGSSTLQEDESGMMRSIVGWDDIIANGQIVMV